VIQSSLAIVVQKFEHLHFLLIFTLYIDGALLWYRVRGKWTVVKFQDFRVTTATADLHLIVLPTWVTRAPTGSVARKL